MASKISYSKSSPYYTTKTFGSFLDVMVDRPIPKNDSDTHYEIDAVYEHRPDLLAHDIYGSASLWWVFAARNPDELQDPIFDFVPGNIIYVPKKATIVSALGL